MFLPLMLKWAMEMLLKSILKLLKGLSSTTKKIYTEDSSINSYVGERSAIVKANKNNNTEVNQGDKYILNINQGSKSTYLHKVVKNMKKKMDQTCERRIAPLYNKIKNLEDFSRLAEPAVYAIVEYGIGEICKTENQEKRDILTELLIRRMTSSSNNDSENITYDKAIKAISQLTVGCLNLITLCYLIRHNCCFNLDFRDCQGCRDLFASYFRDEVIIFSDIKMCLNLNDEKKIFLDHKGRAYGSVKTNDEDIFDNINSITSSGCGMMDRVQLNMRELYRGHYSEYYKYLDLDSLRIIETAIFPFSENQGILNALRLSYVGKEIAKLYYKQVKMKELLIKKQCKKCLRIQEWHEYDIVGYDLGATAYLDNLHIYEDYCNDHGLSNDLSFGKIHYL